jgi:hypothetical protein
MSDGGDAAQAAAVACDADEEMPEAPVRVALRCAARASNPTPQQFAASSAAR